MARVRINRKNRTTIRPSAIIADVNNDGTVDEKDLSIVHKEYEKAKKKTAPKKEVAKKPTAKKPAAKKKAPAKKKK